MNLVRRILEGISEVELQVTPEFQAPGIGEPEVTHGPLKGGVTWTWHLGRGESDTIEGGFSPNLLRIDASISSLFGSWNPWHVVRQAFGWVKDHISDYASEGTKIYLVEVSGAVNEKEYAERLHREGIIDGFAMVGEGKKVNDLTAAHGAVGQPSYQGLFDAIGDLVYEEVVAIHDFNEDPSKENMVWFPGNVTKYPIIDSPLFGAIQKKVEKSGAWWGWSGSKGMFYLYPKAGTSVLTFWSHVRDLADWYLRSGEGGKAKEDDGRVGGEG